MRSLISVLALMGVVAIAGCQGNQANLSAQPTMMETPSGGAVPGQDAY